MSYSRFICRRWWSNCFRARSLLSRVVLSTRLSPTDRAKCTLGVSTAKACWASARRLHASIHRDYASRCRRLCRSVAEQNTLCFLTFLGTLLHQAATNSEDWGSATTMGKESSMYRLLSRMRTEYNKWQLVIRTRYSSPNAMATSLHAATTASAN